MNAPTINEQQLLDAFSLYDENKQLTYQHLQPVVWHISHLERLYPLESIYSLAIGQADVGIQIMKAAVQVAAQSIGSEFIKFSNHWRFEIAFSDVVLHVHNPVLLGQALTTAQIKEHFSLIARCHPVLAVEPGSILPNDHGAGNKGQCWCSGTSQQVFDSFAQYPGSRTHLYQPQAHLGDSKVAQLFFNTYGYSDGLIVNDLISASTSEETDAERIGSTVIRQTPSRVGHHGWRKRLDEFWKNRCAVTGFELPQKNILVGSHIKPWAVSNEHEKVDVYNGLLLTPNLDKLFDQGLISFDDDGNILVSRALRVEQLAALCINKKMQISRIEHAHLKYLSYHRKCVFVDENKSE